MLINKLSLSSAESLDITEHQGSHMIFTLHVYQYRIDKTGRGGGINLIFILYPAKDWKLLLANIVILDNVIS